jgi:DNA repair ATPase RecN
MEYRQIRNKIKYVVDLIENKTSNITFYFKMNIDELDLMRERYLKLVDIHGQLQVQNSLLEERILSIVETYSTEKSQLEQALSDAKEQIVYLQETVNELQTEKQRYKDDCNLAVRLLHRYPNEFISTTSGQIPEQLKNRYEVV